MNKDEFKKRWESDESGSGITFADIADCAKAWGVASMPEIMPIDIIRHEVLKAANTNDAEDFNPETNDKGKSCKC